MSSYKYEIKYITLYIDVATRFHNKIETNLKHNILIHTLEIRNYGIIYFPNASIHNISNLNLYEFDCRIQLISFPLKIQLYLFSLRLCMQRISTFIILYEFPPLKLCMSPYN